MVMVVVRLGASLLFHNKSTNVCDLLFCSNVSCNSNINSRCHIESNGSYQAAITNVWLTLQVSGAMCSRYLSSGRNEGILSILYDTISYEFTESGTTLFNIWILSKYGECWRWLLCAKAQVLCKKKSSWQFLFGILGLILAKKNSQFCSLRTDVYQSSSLLVFYTTILQFSLRKIWTIRIKVLL